MSYVDRCIDSVLKDSLEALGGVVIEGARGTGKTSTALNHARSSVRLDESPELIALAELNPGELLDGETPRLIDEWQLAPLVWNKIRHEIDARQKKGQFILTGSAEPTSDITRHSGAGRFARIHMGTMSLAESGHSSRSVSWGDLLEGGDYTKRRPNLRGKSDLSYSDMAERAVTGGWPGLLGSDEKNARLYNRSYLANLWHANTGPAERFDVTRMSRLIESLSRNIATEASISTLVNDVAGMGVAIDRNTVPVYLDRLRRIFIYNTQPAFSVKLRSKARLRQAAKHHFIDPSLALAALNASSRQLAKDPEFFGQVFESMVVRDLRAFASTQYGEVSHFRDSSGLEVDCIVHYPGGPWAGVEVKLGGHQRIEEAEASLLNFASKIDTEAAGTPAVLAVITATEYAYQLDSGVMVIPLGVLGP